MSAGPLLLRGGARGGRRSGPFRAQGEEVKRLLRTIFFKKI